MKRTKKINSYLVNSDDVGQERQGLDLCSDKIHKHFLVEGRMLSEKQGTFQFLLSQDNQMTLQESVFTLLRENCRVCAAEGKKSMSAFFFFFFFVLCFGVGGMGVTFSFPNSKCHTFLLECILAGACYNPPPSTQDACLLCEHPPWQQLFPFFALRLGDITSCLTRSV